MPLAAEGIVDPTADGVVEIDRLAEMFGVGAGVGVDAGRVGTAAAAASCVSSSASTFAAGCLRGTGSTTAN
jgi:hypothetical protein